MSKFKLIVFANSMVGREDEFNDWYNNVHLTDVVALDGFASAERFRISRQITGKFDHKYLAIYEMDGDPSEAMAVLQAADDRGEMFISGALDTIDIDCAVFERCSDIVRATDGASSGALDGEGALPSRERRSGGDTVGESR